MATIERCLDVFRAELEDEDSHIEDAVRVAIAYALAPAVPDHSAPALRELAPNIHELVGARIYQTPSRTHPDVDHLITEHNGAWHCTCPATTTECWHVRSVRNALNDEGP